MEFSFILLTTSRTSHLPVSQHAHILLCISRPHIHLPKDDFRRMAGEKEDLGPAELDLYLRNEVRPRSTAD